MSLKLSLLLAISVFSFSQDVMMSSYVKSTTVQEKEMFKLFIEFTWNGKLPDYKIRLDQEPLVYGLEVLGKGSSNKILKSESGIDQCKYILIYNLKPTRRGVASIEAISATAIHTSDGTDFKLSSGKIDLTIEKYVEPFSITSKTSLTIIAVVFVFLSLIWILLLVNKRKKSKMLEMQSMEIPLEEELMNKIKRMNFTEGIPEKTAKEFIGLFESYNSNHDLEKLELSFDYSRFRDKIDRYKYSGDAPDIYEFDQMKIDFSEILNHNLSQKKNEVNQ